MLIFNDITYLVDIMEKLIPTSKYRRAMEALLEVVFKLFGLYLTYLAFNWFGEILLKSDYRADTLFSVVLLPALYILKDAHVILAPIFVKVKDSGTSITVTTGILTKRVDKLGFETVENIEVIQTIARRLFGFGTVDLYAYGSGIRIPYVKNVDSFQALLEPRLKHKFDKLEMDESL